MTAPRVIVDLTKVAENTRKVVDRCAHDGIRVVGMTKGVAGLPAVASAMLAGGVEMLGDSRLDNIERMRQAGIEAPIMLTRTFAPSEIERCVELADVSAAASPDLLPILSAQAARRGRRHGVLVMVELGTRREGLRPSEVLGACEQVLALDRLDLVGLGVYFPNTDVTGYYLKNLRRLVTLEAEIESTLRVDIPYVSGGSSNVFSGLTIKDLHVPGVNELHIGTAILIGSAQTEGPCYIPGYHGDAFRLESEVIEIKERDGVIHGLLALGSLDTDTRYLYPADETVRILEATSDHTVIEFRNHHKKPRVGDQVLFGLSYPSLSHLMTSPYTRFRLLGDWNTVRAVGHRKHAFWRKAL